MKRFLIWCTNNEGERDIECIWANNDHEAENLFLHEYNDIQSIDCIKEVS